MTSIAEPLPRLPSRGLIEATTPAAVLMDAWRTLPRLPSRGLIEAMMTRSQFCGYSRASSPVTQPGPH